MQNRQTSAPVLCFEAFPQPCWAKTHPEVRKNNPNSSLLTHHFSLFSPPRGGVFEAKRTCKSTNPKKVDVSMPSLLQNFLNFF